LISFRSAWIYKWFERFRWKLETCRECSLFNGISSI